MTRVGLRKLRQDASELVRRVEAGEEITITVSGRPSARLVPAAPQPWRSWAEVSQLFRGAPDLDWAEDQALVDADLHDSWAGR